MDEINKSAEDTSVYRGGKLTEENWKSFAEYAVETINTLLNDTYRLIDILSAARYKMSNASSCEECIAIVEMLNNKADTLKDLRAIF